MDLANAIQSARKAAGLTTEQAARAAGISRSYWEKLEANQMRNPGVEKLNRIAVALKVTAAALISPQVSA